MTYNFDPDRWFENQRQLLEAQRREGRLDEVAFAARLEELERKYEDMLQRLNKPFELPR
jgi:hypothetical protein